MNIEQSYFHSLDKNQGKPSLWNGIWCYFEIDGHDIAFFGSCFNGMERVYVDDELVSERRNLVNFKGTHSFKIDDSEYVLVFELENMITGKYTCSLGKPGVRAPIEIKTSQLMKTKRSVLVTFSHSLVYGYFFGSLSVLLVKSFFGQ